MGQRKKFWKLLINQVILGIAHIFWCKHKVGQNEQKIPQNYKNAEIHRVKLVLVDLYSHDKED
jgi:hypothetical protein